MRKSIAVLMVLTSHIVMADDTGRSHPTYVNPQLADSPYPIVHAFSDVSTLSGPTGPSRHLRPEEMKYAATGPSGSFVGMFSPVYPDGKRVFWLGGYDRVTKVDPVTLEILSTYGLGDKTYYGETETERHLATLDKLSQAGDLKGLVDYGIKIWLEPWESITNFYRFVNNKNELFIPYRHLDGAVSLRVFGDEDPTDRYSRIRLKHEWKIPAEISRSTICGMNITTDGYTIVSTMDGKLFALAPDFKTYTYVQLPAKSAASLLSAKSSKEAYLDEDIFDTFVRNGITMDDHNAIYIASRDYLHKVQWTGTKLSLDEADGAWKITYPDNTGRGIGTTPTLMGRGPNEDHLLIFADGDARNNAVVVWRDAVPKDWRGIPGHDRRIAGIEPIRFGVSANEPLEIEFAPVVWGYEAFFAQFYTSDFNNSRPMFEPKSPSAKWLAQSFLFNVPGQEVRGVAKIAWNPRKRRLQTVWRSQSNFGAILPVVSSANGILYTWGVRDGEWALQGTDWKTGKNAFYYVLGKSHRYNPMGAQIALVPDGSVLCVECGLGIVRIMPEQ